MRRRHFLIMAVVGALLCGPAFVIAQTPMGTAFTYQGQLRKDNAPVWGTADLQFGLWDAATGGNQIGPTLTMNNMNVERGLCGVTLDFGTDVFAGDARWLELAVRSPAGVGSFTTLSPRQELTPAPHALYADVAGSVPGGVTASGTPTANYLAKFTSSNSVGDSAVYQSGGNIGIGTTSPGSKFDARASAGDHGTAKTGSFSSNVAKWGTAHALDVKATKSTWGTARAIYAEANAGDSYGDVTGLHAKAVGQSYTDGWGVRSEISSGNYGTVYGLHSKATASNFGTAYGVYGTATAGSFQSTAWAGYFAGNAQVTGTLSKGGGSFKIDHPLDPANKYLYHSFVESPDMMNVYNGNVVLDEYGEASVQLPDWFEVLNRDFRYQLTCIGGFAPVYIAEKIHEGSFAIAGGQPGLEVSWQVTGIRQDPFANAHRIPVEIEKPENEAGSYLHPELYDMPEELRVDNWLDSTSERMSPDGAAE